MFKSNQLKPNTNIIKMLFLLILETTSLFYKVKVATSDPSKLALAEEDTLNWDKVMLYAICFHLNVQI